MKHYTAPRLRQSGVTLIELMISLTLGMIIMIAVISAYIGAAGAGRTAEALGRMNEDGQTALAILSQQLRMAGVNPSQSDRSTATVAGSPNLRGNSVPLHNTVTNAFAIRACDVTFSNISAAASTAALTCGHVAGSTGPDSISVGYEADRYNTIPAGDGRPTDCMGSGITALTPAQTYFKSDQVTTVSPAIYEAENRYFIGTSAFVVSPTLYCKGNGTANAQPLVENIEDLQFTFGTVNPTTTTFPYVTVTPTFTTTMVLGYLTAHEVENAFDNSSARPILGIAGATPSRWNAVKTVRICVVARSETQIVDSLASARYLDCNGTVVTNPPDRRLRRAYTTSVILRNQ